MYVVGINATDASKTIQLNLRQLGVTQGAILITDGATNRNFSTRSITSSAVRITLPPRDRFVMQPK